MIRSKKRSKSPAVKANIDILALIRDGEDDKLVELGGTLYASGGFAVIQKKQYEISTLIMGQSASLDTSEQGLLADVALKLDRLWSCYEVPFSYDYYRGAKETTEDKVNQIFERRQRRKVLATGFFSSASA